MMKQLELLSPARDLACGIAAIDHGADAVYIGARQFGARAAAGNSVADIAELCRYAHEYAARVYVTVNTIVYDDELPAVRTLLRELADAGADAVLFQDMAIPVILRDMANRGLALHASTQTDNRTAEKVAWLRDAGASRVVLARELSVEEIADIHRRVPDVELEVFVHGALCVSYSGLCYASQHCFARSANRGECAQLCRMKYDLTDADGRTIEHGRHLLSLKDLNQSEHLAELIAAGATSFKIEGRLKDVAYVKNVTAAYSQLLDRFISDHPGEYRRASLGHCRYAFTPDLKKTFNRGYTTYFLHGRQPDIFSPDTPKAMGEYVGTVKALPPSCPPKKGRLSATVPTTFSASITVSGTATFSNGDGLCFIDDNRELQGFRVNRAEGNRLTVAGQLPPTLRPGMRLYRNNDQQMERLLAGKSAERKIPLSMALTATPDGFRLTADISCRALGIPKGDACGNEVEQESCSSNSEDRMTATIVCEHQQAQKPQRENIIRELTKLGNTPYECREVFFPPDFNFFIPASRLSELRRAVTSLPLSLPPVESALSEEVPYTSTVWQTPTPPYSLNIANRLARDFYSQQAATATSQGIAIDARLAPAFELQEPQGSKVLMQCRHCLRYALGHCVKHGGTAPTWREPLFLSLANGRRFRLDFDCRNCQMNVICDE